MALRPKGDTIVDPTNRRVSRITHMQESTRLHALFFFPFSLFLSCSLLFFLSLRLARLILLCRRG